MDKHSFEKDLKKLEGIVEDLEKRNTDLEHSLKIFEDGIKISRLLIQQLETAEKKVEILLKGDDGENKAVPFNSTEKE